MSKTVFISYSNLDKEYLDEIESFLRPLKNRHHIDIWFDKRIESGQKWNKEIQDALNRSFIAILLITPQFLASEYIEKHERPALLRRAEKGDCRILPFNIEISLIDADPELKEYQAHNTIDEPFSLMGQKEKGNTLRRLGNRILELSQQYDSD